MGNHKHVVNRLIVEVLTGNDKGADSISEKLDQAFQSDLLNDVEKIFDDLIETNAVYRFDKLVIDLGTLNKEFFENEFEEKFKLKLKEELKEKIVEADNLLKNAHNETSNETERSIKNNAEAEFELLKYFLISGSLPWWSNNISMNEIESLIENQLAKDAGEVLSFLSNNKTALKRASLQFSNSLLVRILKKTNAKISSLLTEKTWLSEAHKRLNKVSDLNTHFSKYYSEFWKEYFYSQFSELSKSFSEKELQQISWEAYLNSTGLKLNERLKIAEQIFEFYDTKKSGTDKSNENSNKDALDNNDISEKDIEAIEGIFINNAGLILLAPFLIEFFKRIGCTKENKFLDSHEQNRAAHLLQFAVTGKTKHPEFLLPLNKILCGLDHHAPVPIEIEIKKEEKIETENLLKSVIKNFSAIKNTSIEGLRLSFLEREGKITENEFDWRLIVERKSHDIILEKLPWSISIVKLPWMKKPINVEW